MGNISTKELVPARSVDAIVKNINETFDIAGIDITASKFKAENGDYNIICIPGRNLNFDDFIKAFKEEYPQDKILSTNSLSIEKPKLTHAQQLEWRYFNNPSYTIRSSKSHDLSFLEDVKKEMAAIFEKDKVSIKVSIKVSTDDKGFEVQLENVGARTFCETVGLQLKPAQDKHPSTRTNLFTGR